jgi:hypothetical protein
MVLAIVVGIGTTRRSAVNIGFTEAVDLGMFTARTHNKNLEQRSYVLEFCH